MKKKKDKLGYVQKIFCDLTFKMLLQLLNTEREQGLKAGYIGRSVGSRDGK